MSLIPNAAVRVVELDRRVGRLTAEKMLLRDAIEGLMEAIEKGGPYEPSMDRARAVLEETE